VDEAGHLNETLNTSQKLKINTLLRQIIFVPLSANIELSRGIVSDKKVFACFFCLREFFNRDTLHSHQDQCSERSTASDIISGLTKSAGTVSAETVKSQTKTGCQSLNKSLVSQSDVVETIDQQQKEFLSGLGLVSTTCAAVVRAARRQSKEVVCDVIIVDDSDEEEEEDHGDNEVDDFTSSLSILMFIIHINNSH